ncbi:MAG TPA: CPBP family intramembrane glutamic endopeptidase [Anaerolineales bacterium]|jgi:membrane protease YdiL (CAAX protease family)
MLNRRSLASFLLIAFTISWALFAIPLAFKSDQQKFPLVMQACFALAMWGPGIAAILTALFVERLPLNSLRLNTLGPKRFYLWAWFLPPILTLLTLAATIMLGTGQFDPGLTMLNQALSRAPSGNNLPSAGQVAAMQLAFAVLLAPFLNVVFALGEELGWRGFLLPRLLPLGQWPAILLSGAIWGFWHAPTTLLFGYNFPEHPYLGVLVMVVGCTLLGAIIAWLYLSTRSPWAAALAHAAINASPGLAIFFLKPGFDSALGGLILGVAGWLPMLLFLAWLVWSKLLPVPVQTDPLLATNAI